MRDFHFRISGEVAGSWRNGSSPTWRISDGNLFYLATWSTSQADYGWFGIYHASLSELDDRAPKLAQQIVKWTQSVNHHSCLTALSDETPGWGLVRVGSGRAQMWRDPIGRLPLFLQRSASGLQWATRPASLTDFRVIARHSRLTDFLKGSDDSGRDDFWSGVYRLRAGETMGVTTGGRQTFSTWWPPDVESLNGDEDVTQRVGDLLHQAVERGIARGARLLSLSGGIDSSLLLTLMIEQGCTPRTFSMVDSTTTHFDERYYIEQSLAHLSVRGEFVDIGGPMQWEQPQVHHPFADFGPTPQPEAAYFIPYLKTITQNIDPKMNPILMMGLGADQLFWCSPHIYALDNRIDKESSCRASLRGDWRKISEEALIRAGVPRIPLLRMRSKQEPPGTPPKMKSASRGLRWRAVYCRDRWISARSRQFQSWSWECAMRLVERYRRSTGLLFELPFLTTELAEFALRLPPRALGSGIGSKRPLRQLLRHRLPSCLIDRRKAGTFDEVIANGLANYFRPPIDTLFNCSRLDEFPFFSEVQFVDHFRDLVGCSSANFALSDNSFWRPIASELWLQQALLDLPKRHRNLCQLN